MADSEQITHPKQARCPKCGAPATWRCYTRDGKRRIHWLRNYCPERWALVNQAARQAS